MESEDQNNYELNGGHILQLWILKRSEILQRVARPEFLYEYPLANSIIGLLGELQVELPPARLTVT